MKFNQVIFPEADRISRQPIKLWLKELNNSFNSINVPENNRDEKWLSNLEIIINQLSLICFYLNEQDLSEKICLKGQNFYYYMYFIKGYNCPNKFGFLQPGINLIRLDRFTNKWTQGISKLSNLFSDNRKQINFACGSIAITELSEVSKNLIVNCYCEEFSRLLLNMKKYNELKHFISNIHNFDISSHTICFLLEIQLIVNFYLNEKNETIKLLYLYESNVPNKYKIIFYLKYIHLLIEYEEKELAKDTLRILLSKLQLLSIYDLGTLKFYYLIAQTCKILEIKKDQEKLCTWLLNEFKKKNDELLYLETLSMMRHKKSYNNIWMVGLNNTEYIKFKNKFYPESIHNNNMVISLVEKILKFLDDKK